MNVYVILRDNETVESFPWNPSFIVGIFTNRNHCIKNLKEIIQQLEVNGYSSEFKKHCCYKDLAINGSYGVILTKKIFDVIIKVKYTIITRNLIKG